MEKEQLGKYVKLKMEVENQLERITRARSQERFPSIQEGAGARTTPGSSDRMAEAIIRRMDLEERLSPIISAKLDEMEHVEKTIDLLGDPMEREVLRVRYIDGENCMLTPWRDVAMKVYGNDDERHIQAIYRLHGRALQHIKRV